MPKPRLNFCVILPLFFMRLTLAAVAHAEPPLILGVHPYLSATDLHNRFTPLVEHLSKRLNRQLTLRISSSYEAHVEAIDSGAIDLALMGPAPYVMLTAKANPVPLLAAFESHGSRTFTAIIAVRRDSAISELSQLKGKNVALGPLPSTMSNIVPRAMLLKAGLAVSQLGKVDYMTNHDNIALGVLAAAFDAGAMKEDVFHRYEAQGLRALATSEPVADHLFVARRGLDDGLIRELRTSLLSLGETEEGRRILTTIQANLTAFLPAHDADYDGLRALIRSLEQ